MNQKQENTVRTIDNPYFKLTTDMFRMIGRIADLCPSELAVIYDAVYEEIEKVEVPKDIFKSDSGIAFESNAMKTGVDILYPLLIARSDVQSALGRINKEFKDMPITEIPSPKSVSVAFIPLGIPAAGAVVAAAGIGIGGGLVLMAGLAAYGWYGRMQEEYGSG